MTRRQLASGWGVALGLAWAAAFGRAADWPQWRGLHRDGATPEVVAPWKTPPAAVWRHRLGEGHSSPVVADGRVFVQARDKDQEVVECLRADDGTLLWRHSDPVVYANKYGSGPRATPLVDGPRVYTLGVTGRLLCLDTASGMVRWQHDVLREFHAPNLTFGVSASPILEAGKLLINVGGPGASIVAFDARSGTVVWKNLDDRASYASPIALGRGADRQVIFVTQQGPVSVRPSDGSLLWRYPMITVYDENACTPVLAANLVIVTSVSYGAAGLVPRAATDHRAEAAWQSKVFSCYFSTPVRVGADIYAITGTPAALESVAAATGQEHWTHGTGGLLSASLIRTGDNKLLMLTDTGLLTLIDPNPGAYRQLAQSKVCGPTWVAPAIAGGRLFVRDAEGLHCFQLGGPGAPERTDRHDAQTPKTK